jgi:hypothetical protein
MMLPNIVIAVSAGTEFMHIFQVLVIFIPLLLVINAFLYMILKTACYFRVMLCQHNVMFVM